MTLIDPLGKTNWTFVTIVVIAGIVVGGGVFLLSLQPFEVPQKPSQQVPTEGLPRDEVLRGWQTYRNDEFGFELKYPKEIFVMVPTVENVYPESYTPYKGSKLIFAGREKTIQNVPETVFENGISFIVVDKNIAKWLSSVAENYPVVSVSILGGKEATVIRWSEETDYGDYMYYISLEENRTLVIHVGQGSTSGFTYGESVGWASTSELDDQILSTFRFTK